MSVTTTANLNLIADKQYKLIKDMIRVYDVILKNMKRSDSDYAFNYSFDILSNKYISIDDIDFSKFAEVGRNKWNLFVCNFFESFEDSGW